jgi:hypothetical protein
MGDQPDARPVPTQDNTTQKKKRGPTSMPRAEFEPSMPMFERSKSVRAIDRVAIETDVYFKYNLLFLFMEKSW